MDCGEFIGDGLVEQANTLCWVHVECPFGDTGGQASTGLSASKAGQAARNFTYRRPLPEPCRGEAFSPVLNNGMRSGVYLFDEHYAALSLNGRFRADDHVCASQTRHVATNCWDVSGG